MNLRVFYLTRRGISDGYEYIYNVILCSSAIFYSLLINNIRSISAFVTGASIGLNLQTLLTSSRPSHLRSQYHHLYRLII